MRNNQRLAMNYLCDRSPNGLPTFVSPARRAGMMKGISLPEMITTVAGIDTEGLSRLSERASGNRGYWSAVWERRRDMVMIMAMWTMASWCLGRVS